MEKMEQAGKSKIYIQQGSKSAATISTVLINLGVFQALQNYPKMQLMGFQYGEYGYEGGRVGAESALAVRTDYEGMWSAADSMATGALKALRDRGVEIGAYTASRDMEMTTAQDILKGRFLVTSGFAIPYYGGRLVPMLYDMCVGAWYPTPEEMLQTGKLTVYGRPGELEKLAEDAGIAKHPSFKTGPTEENLKQILTQIKEKNPQYPYDFRLLSVSKTKELGLKFDRTAGAGTTLGAHDYYYIAKLKKFGSVAAWKKHVAALYDYFLDISWMTDQKAAKEMAKKFPKDLKVEALWE
jgi:ribose transport system substrate-binding protein